ncbi:MAG: hypothetical protein F2704_04765 [Actinobacteria bacterium]|uniref:Unannotated protein n=1 Tax=freshwater metagenome TaxID=449393 RepID=A0A6J7U524_9ZZZZ|nr:hypothetical protein [Actinomycetota bacterium]MSW47758.1 hypothetical protein [Actinomycetota bacterium]MSX25183.1 hypothetical protein [Actinomycetota bacterium]MSY46903.1 hypothetical protein [Actinomycetota bacterium]MSY57559.1 hypothetical protein [Actinomycetota bacterium]
MRKIVSSIVASALVLLGGAVAGGSAAYAATTPTLVVSGGSTVFGLDPAVITATASTAGAVKFYAADAVVTGCEAVATTTVTPFVAKCSWVPAAAGATALKATLTPTDVANFTAVDSNVLTVKIGLAVQGVISPIHLYVDTVLASGSSGPLAPRFGVSCAITSQFIIGQTIVFRVYANNADLGGAVMDSSNTAEAYIEVAGVPDKIKMSYGNHSGVAFWTGILATGTVAPKYSTLGLISYKVTMVAKDQTKVKILSTKLVAKKVDGKRVMVDGKTVYERVSYYRTVTVTPALKGAVGTWQSNFTPSSQVTLYAVPA